MCTPGSSAPRRVARHSRDKQNPSTNAAPTKRRRSSSRRETSLETAKAIGPWPLRAPSRPPRTATQPSPHTTSRATWDSGISLQANPPCPVSTGSYAARTGAQGWPELSLYKHDLIYFPSQLTKGTHRVYRFNGNMYQAVACTSEDHPMGSPTPTYSSCSLRPDQEAAGMPPGLYTTLINELRDDLKDAIRAGQDCLPLKDKIGAIEPFDQKSWSRGQSP